MAKRNLLRIIGNALSPDGTQVDFSAFDQSVETLKKSLKEKIQIQTLDDVNSQMEKFRQKIDLKPLTDAMAEIKTSFAEETDKLSQQIQDKTDELGTLFAKKGESKSTIQDLSNELSDLKIQLSSLEIRRKGDIEAVNNQIQGVKDFNLKMEGSVNQILSDLDVIRETESKEEEINKEVAKEFQNSLEKLRSDLMTRIANIGGGSMNRQIFFNSTDYLTKYTDINWKAGTNVTFTIANNNATKKVDITISATGGGGGGMVRSINSISVNTVAGSASGTDYVYLCTGTITLTMPDATAGNTNLYTVKNVGTGVVTVNTTSAQTIDNDATAIMPVRYTSIDLISDTANWSIT